MNINQLQHTSNVFSVFQITSGRASGKEELS